MARRSQCFGGQRAHNERLWVMSLIGNSETLLYECQRQRLLRPAGWVTDGRSIYVDLGNNMLSISVSPAGGGAPHTVFTIPEDIRPTASVSADGRKFVLSVHETKSDVWIVENFDPAYRK